MKKDFIQDILINLLAKRKERIEDDKLMKKKYESFSLVERNAYEQMIDKRDNSHIYIITAPFYVVFYLGVFGLVMKYAFNTDILTTIKPIVQPILGLFPMLILLWALLLFFNFYELNKLKRELLLNK